MIKCDPSLFKYDYVRLKKITGSYLYISSDVNDHAYKNGQAKKDKYKGRDIYKVKIHENVSRQYFKNNNMKEFSDKGTFACIAYYGDIVVAIEVKKDVSNVEKSKEWVSTIENVMRNIYKILPTQKNVYINGKEIFWVDDDPTTKALSRNISSDGCFKILYVKYLSLDKIGAEIAKEKSNTVATDEDKDSYSVIKTIGNKLNFTSEQVEFLNFESNFADYSQDDKMTVAIVKTGSILYFNPNANNDNLKNIDCFSPVFNFGEKEVDQLHSFLMSINDLNNPVYLNLNFLLKAGRIIGEKYGFEETEILNISDVIFDTKVVSFQKITEDSRKNYPIKLHPFDGLSWLFKHIHNETNLNESRDLSNLFVEIFKKGFVARNKVVVNYKNGKNESDIKLVKYQSAFVQNNLV